MALTAKPFCVGKLELRPCQQANLASCGPLQGAGSREAVRTHGDVDRDQEMRSAARCLTTPRGRGVARSTTRALLLLALSLGAAAVEVHVDTGNWKDQVEAAGAGVVVVFAAGRYGGCSTGGLALASGVALVGAAGAAATVIDCGGEGRHFAVKGGASVRIEGLTLTGGAAAVVGRDSGEGGCVLVEGPGGSVVVADSVFSDCSATRGGAIAVRGVALNIRNSNFTGNGAGEHGGAIHADASTLNVSSSRFKANTAGSEGGAVSLPFVSVSLLPALVVSR